MRVSTAWALVGLLLAASCTQEAASPSAPGASRPSPTGDPELWRTDLEEPYAFTTPVPPLAATPIDGTYGRDFSEGTEPIPCRRCAPYRLDRGPSTLELDAGRFRVDHQSNAFGSQGHYLVEGHELILFNDPECPTTRGVYRWELQGGTLTLEEVDDPCPFDLLRARYLMAAPWQAATTA
jgi:hypothetical protein